MRPGLLSEIVTIGYEIFLEGENIRLRYHKQGDPPDNARTLIRELKAYKNEALELLKKMGEPTSTTPHPTPEWSTPMGDLVNWFLNSRLPEEPFSLSPYEKALHPDKYYMALRLDIEAGPQGPRARALAHDLRRLKNFCLREGGVAIQNNSVISVQYHIGNHHYCRYSS